VLVVVWGVKTQTHQHTNSLLKKLEALLWNEREVRVFRALLALFLDCNLRTTLQNIKGYSASTASRFMSCEHAPDAVFWQELNEWQRERLYGVPRRGRRGDVVLKLDLTCIEKTGKRIPFARVFNRTYGIQLVVLHVCFGGLSFPLAYRIYRGKGKETPVDLALELLEAFPASAWGAQTVVLADAGFGSCDFIQGCRDLGFSRLLVGVRCDRKLSDGRKLTQMKRRGEKVVLHDLAEQPLYISWCDVKRDGGKKRFYVVSTFAAGGAYLARRYRKRWLIESFFDSIKHDFGLKEARLRTHTGIRLWIFFACLAYSLASLARFLSKQPITLLEAAQRILDMLLDVRLVHLMLDCEHLSQCSPLRLKLVVV
jgi:hypothetical protein